VHGNTVRELELSSGSRGQGQNGSRNSDCEECGNHDGCVAGKTTTSGWVSGNESVCYSGLEKAGSWAQVQELTYTRGPVELANREWLALPKS
jgi:hypothetical protein